MESQKIHEIEPVPVIGAPPAKIPDKLKKYYTLNDEIPVIEKYYNNNTNIYKKSLRLTVSAYEEAFEKLKI